MGPDSSEIMLEVCGGPWPQASLPNMSCICIVWWIEMSNLSWVPNWSNSVCVITWQKWGNPGKAREGPKGRKDVERTGG